MEEDELDPAFADLDSPSLLSNSFEAHGLGRGFGSLSDDLGAGFGNSLSNELDLFNHSQQQGATTPPRGDGALGHAFDDEQDELVTLRKRVESAGGPSPHDSANRLSLAFELASAASPGRSNSRDLLRELGIEEDGEGSGGEQEECSDEEEDEDSGEDSTVLLNGSKAARPPSRQLGDSFAGGARSSGNITPLRFPSSTDTTLPSSSAASSNGREEEDDLAREEEIDAAALESTAALNRSMETTSLFLSRLRQHTIAEVDPHVAPPSVYDSSAPVDFTDRQPVVESLASSVIKSMYDVAKQREGQVRELAEMERVFARSDPAWQAALAELEELPKDDDEEQNEVAPTSLRPMDEPTSPIPPYSPAIPSADFPSINGNFSAHDATTQASLPPPPPSALSELSSLRALTASLISALATINEVAQVNQAATGEAGRKLRALKGHLVTVKDDLQGVAASEEFIADFEAREERRARISGGRSRAEEAREETESAGRMLEESWVKAQRMLSVSA